jgi:hypothetical protein
MTRYVGIDLHKHLIVGHVAAGSSVSAPRSSIACAARWRKGCSIVLI